MERMQISPVSFGLAIGVFWGVSVLLMGLMAHFFTFEEGVVTIIGNMYIEYQVSIIGSVLRGIIAFVDGFVTGIILAWLYNFFARHSVKNKKK